MNELGSVSPYTAVLGALSFFGSVVAALLALNLYSLLRTGKVGASWRVLIIASFIFAVLQATRLLEVVFPLPDEVPLSSVIELVFILALAYAFFLQRRLFVNSEESANETDDALEAEGEEPVVSVYEKY